MPTHSKKKSVKQSKRVSRSQKTKTVPTTAVTDSVKLLGVKEVAIRAFELLRTHRSLFGKLTLLIWVSTMIVSFSAEQTQYRDLLDAVPQAVTTIEDGSTQFWFSVWILLSSVISGSLLSSLNEVQQLFRAFVFLVGWLVALWLLRHVVSGTPVKLRDGLYSGGAPLVSTLLVALFGIVQLLPLALAVAVVATLASTGVLAEPLIGLGSAAVIIGLFVLSLYWLCATLFALLIVTIPGTYPLTALRSAKALLRGIRLKVILRFIGGLAAVVALYVAALIPFVLLDAGPGLLGGWVTVSVTSLLSAAMIVAFSTYIYVLYRSVIDERAITQ